MIVICDCTECVHNVDGYCDSSSIYISNEEMTAAGMIPQCTDYKERQDDEARIDASVAQTNIFDFMEMTDGTTITKD